MFYDNNILNTLHLEITTKCNAACPMCSRNLEGYGVNPNINIKNMTLNELKTNISVNFIEKIHRIMLCGNFGDPLMNPELILICDYLKSKNQKIKIEVHTNGGVGTVDTWRALASLTHFCRFGIDGLEDSNHTYRRGVNWNTLMRNIETFISSGGSAEWAYLIFKHNRHQVEQAKQLSEKMGFKKFIPKLTSRYYSSNGQSQVRWPVYKSKDELEYYLEPPQEVQFTDHYSDIKKVFDDTSNKFQKYIETTPIKCKVKKEKSIYMDVNGRLFPCCWLGIDYSNKKTSNGTVRGLMKMQGLNEDVLKSTTGNPSDVSSEELFKSIKESWGDQNRIKKCAHICGEGFDPFLSQFKVNIYD